MNLCLWPLGFLALGLAEDVALGLLLENPSGLQSTPGGRWSTLGTTLGQAWAEIHLATLSPFPQIIPNFSKGLFLVWLFAKGEINIQARKQI